MANPDTKPNSKRLKISLIRQKYNFPTPIRSIEVETLGDVDRVVRFKGKIRHLRIGIVEDGVQVQLEFLGIAGGIRPDDLDGFQVGRVSSTPASINACSGLSGRSEIIFPGG